jgi:hypothetical protein
VGKDGQVRWEGSGTTAGVTSERRRRIGTVRAQLTVVFAAPAGAAIWKRPADVSNAGPAKARRPCHVTAHMAAHRRHTALAAAAACSSISPTSPCWPDILRLGPPLP